MGDLKRLFRAERSRKHIRAWGLGFRGSCLGVWVESMGFGVRRFGTGVWGLVFMAYDLVFGVWSLEFRGQRRRVRNMRSLAAATDTRPASLWGRTHVTSAPSGHTHAPRDHTRATRVRLEYTLVTREDTHVTTHDTQEAEGCTDARLKAVWKKSIPTQIRQLIHYISNSKG